MDEVSEYLNMPPERTQEQDLISWWVGKRSQYPQLCLMAMDLLSIPSMSSENERVFSLAKLCMTLRRLSLDEKSVAAVQCLKY